MNYPQPIVVLPAQAGRAKLPELTNYSSQMYSYLSHTAGIAELIRTLLCVLIS